MGRFYYKVPKKWVDYLGLSGRIEHPDGNYLLNAQDMARINPDINKALEMTGGIMLTLDQARDDQRGIASYPLPGEETEPKPTMQVIPGDGDAEPATAQTGSPAPGTGHPAEPEAGN